ncbi:hypothetical protein ABIB40_000642 [Pedobacter sp. UYP30]|uniref:DinB family protein n=1 Tax=Pedobacter sp. UYP30 TaxID=1756400 RepID=UPI00339243D6
MDNHHEILITTLEKLLHGGIAHASFADAVKDLPKAARGQVVEKLPYSIWQLVCHIKIAQWDMLEFCKNPNHQSPEWPKEYWPKEAAPKNDQEWGDTIKQIDADLEAFIVFLRKADVYEKITSGDGQTVLLEALQTADHNAYHIAEIVVLRRLQGNWKS